MTLLGFSEKPIVIKFASISSHVVHSLAVID